MKNSEKQNVIPVLLGADLGAYSMAVSFAECGIRPSFAFARDKLAISSTSSIIRSRVVRELDECNTAVPALIEFARESKGERLILVPCADWYVEMLQYARDTLSGHYFFMIPPFEVWRAVSDKASFYYVLDTYKIPHPKTEIFDIEIKDLQKRGEVLKPPFVVKPSDSSEYYRHKFEGMKKVYFAHSLSEAEAIMRKIYSNGYGGKMLLQELIGSGKARASVLTVFIGSDGRVKRAVLGDVALEETSPTARGNYSAIITRPLDAISYKLINMLEGIGYRGFANFDILHDDTESYCLELNPRQGRSFDYTRGAKMEAAQLLVNEMLSTPSSEILSYPEYLWRAVGKTTAFKNSSSDYLAKKGRLLEEMGASYTPFDSGVDGGFLRKLYVGAHLYRCERSFKRDMARKEII